MSTPLIGAGLPTPAHRIQDEQLMRRALALLITEDGADARPADCRADVPVAAIVVDPQGTIVGKGINRREVDGDPTAHAEVLALREAANTVGDGWRLEGCTLVVTVEPCTMCAGAAVGARIGRIVFGAWEPKTGACGSLVEVVRVAGQTHVPDVQGGVLEEDCAVPLAKFFQRRRS